MARIFGNAALVERSRMVCGWMIIKVFEEGVRGLVCGKSSNALAKQNRIRLIYKMKNIFQLKLIESRLLLVTADGVPAQRCFTNFYYLQSSVV